MLLIIFLIFILFLLSRTNTENFFTAVRVNNDDYNLNSHRLITIGRRNTESPVFISGSNVFLVRENSENFINYVSPLPSPRIQNTNIHLTNELIRSNSLNLIEEYQFKVDRSQFKSFPEYICAKTLSEYFGRDLQYNIRPNWLKNPKTGRNLEADVYDPVNRLLLEYDGPQHTEENEYFGVDEEKLLSQKERDKLKRDICKELNIKFIAVDCTVDSYVLGENKKLKYIKRSNEEREFLIRNYIYLELEKLNL